MDQAPAAHAASVLSAQLRVQDLVWGRQFHDEDEEGGVLSRAQGVEEQVLEADLDQVT